MTTKYNQTQLAKLVAEESDVAQPTVDRVLRALFDVVGKTIVAGDSIAVTNFGTWLPVTSRAQQRRNPQTGEMFPVGEFERPVFRFSPAVKEAVRNGTAPGTFQKRGNGRAFRKSGTGA
jgi:DNA-binding protein HU-beta